MRTAKKRNWLLIAVLLGLACIQAVSAVRAPTLPQESSLIVPLEIVFGGGWAIAFLAAAFGYWQRTFSRAAVLLLLSLFVLYNAARLAIFARADYDRQRLPFVAAVAVLAAVVGGLAWLALVIERKQRIFTGKENSKDDVKPQD